MSRLGLPASAPIVPRLDTPHAPGVRFIRRAAVAADRVRLSVVVPFRNLGGLAVEAIESILGQTIRDLEVLAVDDGSTDDTLRSVLSIDDARLACITQPQRGLGAARNTGIRAARAGLVGFCDGDDLWAPEKAERHVPLMEHAPDTRLTFSWSAYLDDSGRPTGQLLISRCEQPTLRDLLARNHVGNGSTAVVRRDAFARAGLFDETLPGCEDIEMWVRLAVFAPGAMRLIPEPLTGYRVRQASMTHAFEKYVTDSVLYVQRFLDYVPGYTEGDAERTYAQHLRIISRKAFSFGDVELSRAILMKALRLSPGLVARDPRALALSVLHLAAFALPRSARMLPYRVGRKVLGRVNSMLFADAFDAVH